MVKRILICLASFLACALWGEDIVLAERGRPPLYVIQPEGDAASPAFRAARLLQNAIRQAAGVELPLSGKPGHSPVIRIEPLPETTGEKPVRWEYRIFFRGKDLCIQGKDESAEVSGTLRGVIALLEHATGFVAFAPGENGYHTPPQRIVSLSDAFHAGNIPRLKFNTTLWTRRVGEIYETANNLFPAPWFHFGGGHTFHAAMPKSLYQTHPEYFALVKGKRLPPNRFNWHSHYCYSQKEVCERIYRETLRRLSDKKYSMVEVGANDGFIPCTCEACRKMSPSEQLWRLHRDHAERLYKAYPSKMLNILAYGPTLTPPQSFREFPPNVMINLAPCTVETVSRWKKIRVPGGFSGYLYNWGHYQFEGFMPKLSLSHLRQQAVFFRSSGILGIYRCGFGELFGLEGPFYYIWGKLLEQPESDISLLLGRYCRAAFETAAPEMERFYKILDARLEIDIPRTFEWYKPELLADHTPALIETLRLMAMRYPPAVLEQLDRLLAGARRKQPESELLKLAEMEFEYLKLTLHVTYAFDDLRKSRSEKDWQRLLTALERRRKFILNLPREKVNGIEQIGEYHGFKLFGKPPLNDLLEGGRLLGRLRGPCNWDPARWRRLGIRPVGRSIAADGKPQLLVQGQFVTPDPKYDQFPVSVAVSGAGTKVNVTFHAPRTEDKDLDQTEFYVFFGNDSRRIRFAGRPCNRCLRRYDRVKTNAQNGGDGDVYRTLEIQIPLIREGKYVRAEFDLSGLGLKGGILDFNASCINSLRYIWEYNMDQKSYKNCNDNCGVLTLQ